MRIKSRVILHIQAMSKFSRQLNIRRLLLPSSYHRIPSVIFNQSIFTFFRDNIASRSVENTRQKSRGNDRQCERYRLWRNHRKGMKQPRSEISILSSISWSDFSGFGSSKSDWISRLEFGCSNWQSLFFKFLWFFSPWTGPGWILIKMWWISDKIVLSLQF